MWNGLCITRQHFGILLVIIGTVCIAFSVRIKRQTNREMTTVVDRLKKENPNIFEPTETTIVRVLLWIGLLCVAVGSFLQW
jgi:hypothetical protein